MSSIKLNLVDSESTLSGTIHASIGDYCVAALAAEPETLSELEAALTRFQRDPIELHFHLDLHPGLDVDNEPYDAGILIVDLAARIVVCDSTYSLPGSSGVVGYHDGSNDQDCPIKYQLDPDEWLFLDSVNGFETRHYSRQQLRTLNPPLDARPVLYGRPLDEFLAKQIFQSISESNRTEIATAPTSETSAQTSQSVSPASDLTQEEHWHETDNPDDVDPLSKQISEIHKTWLITPREDLRGKSPREVMLAKTDLISFDLESRCLQWSILLEGPPCLDRNSFAYRFAGFGQHEWVIYYYLIRSLISQGINAALATQSSNAETKIDELIAKLEDVKLQWLSEPNERFSGHVPFIVLDNERKRMPEAMGGRTMVIDEECPICKMMGDEAEAGLGVFFWHLDGCNMEQDFVFSTYLTKEEWELEQRLYEQISDECAERMAQKERGEVVGDDLAFEPIQVDEFVPWRHFEEEPPEA